MWSNLIRINNDNEDQSARWQRIEAILPVPDVWRAVRPMVLGMDKGHRVFGRDSVESGENHDSAALLRSLLRK